MKHIIALIALFVVVSCAETKTAIKATKDSAIPCATETAKSLTTQFGAIVTKTILDNLDASTRKVDWDPVKDLTKTFAKDTGMCVLTNVVAAIRASKTVDGAVMSAPVDIDEASLLAGFREIAGGQAYQAADGTVLQ